MNNNDHVDEDGFTLVTKKHRVPKKLKKNLQSTFFCPTDNKDNITEDLSTDLIVKQITFAQKDIQGSKFLTTAIKTCEKILKETNKKTFEEILCYGLGNFSLCVSSRYQLAFLLCLRYKYQCSTVFVYDPLFTIKEQEILSENLKLELIKENEEGKRIIEENKCTLIFAPHCPKQLTNNFLWANWTDNINNCIILANSFLKLILQNSKDNNSYILKISPYTKEYTLENIFRYNDIFNDLSFHIFNTSTIGESFWKENKSIPVYSDDYSGKLIKREDVKQFKNIKKITE